MKLEEYIQAFSANQNIFKDLFLCLNEEQIRWKQNEEKWCPLEIVCHLYDEETEDFRVRIKHVFKTPEKAPPPISPKKWVTERAYMQQDFQLKLENFLKERTQSIDWLKTLENPPWDNTYHHKSFGPMSASYFLSNWLAHDYLHIKQLLRLQYDYLHFISSNSLEYAGKWI
jgi:hypothetical protein